MTAGKPHVRIKRYDDGSPTVHDLASKLEQVRQVAQHAFDTGSAVSGGVSLAVKVLAILDGKETP